jgi:hypothetical protein
MTVVAFSSPRDHGGWRWRIVGYSGDDVIEESTTPCSTMAGALAAGQLRVSQINARADARDRPISHGITFAQYR